MSSPDLIDLIDLDDAPRPFDGWSVGLALPPKWTVSQWSDAKRYIARGTGPEPGRWRTARTPFLAEPMDAITDPDVEIVVLMCSSQVGKTELLINVAGYYIDQDPAPLLFVLPSLELADSFSTKRFAPTIEATPALLERIGRHAARDSSTTIREKSYPGGDLVFAGANSPASLASRPRRVVLFDEIDKYKHNIGHDGDPIEQGIQRTQNFWNRKIVLASTPTLKDLSAIEHWYGRSDQRRFLVDCHDCGHPQPLEWETDKGGEHKERRVTWEPGRPETAFYSCAACGSVWDQHQVWEASKRGRWQATAPEVQRIRGYHWGTLYSSWVTMEQLARQWEDSEGKPEKEQTFVNLKLGLTYNPTKSASTTVQQLMDRREDYAPDRLPEGVLLITCFTDVQQDRFETQWLGFGVNEQKWVVDYVVTPADPTSVSDWDRLDADVLSRRFRLASGETIAPEAYGVDAGYLQIKAMEFVRTRKAAFRPFFAVKGVNGFGRGLWAESEQRFKLNAKLYLSGVDDGKTMTYRDLAVIEPEPRVRFPAHLQKSYFEMLLSERVKITYKAGRPKPEWFLPSGKRNEALDTFVGCVAVRHAISVDFEARRRARTAERKPASAGYASLAQAFAT